MTIDQINALLNQTTLPEGIKWYSSGTQRVFTVKAFSNKGEESSLICYLIREPQSPEEEWLKYGIEFKVNQTPTEARNIIDNALAEFMAHIASHQAKSYNPDGGDLGRGDNK